MELLNILIVAIIAYILISMFRDSIKRTSKYDRKHNKIVKRNDVHHDDMNSLNSLFENDMISVDPSYRSSISSVIKRATNPNFINIQFHTDYRDVITGLNNLVPERKQLFNLPNIPLNYSEPNKKEVSIMVKDFLYVLNDNIKTTVPEFKQKNSGWDEVLEDNKGESGWDKVQKSLGLPVSLYDEPAPKSHIKLIDIEKVQKYETDDEIKYAIQMVIQKINVQDQMRMLVSFVQDKRLLTDENDFFKEGRVETRLVIEDLFILGYYSFEGEDEGKEFDNDNTKYFEYDKLEHNQLVDPKDVQKELTRKYQIRNKEMNELVNTFDEEGRAFHKALPNVYDFSNIQGTRTIYDDFNEPKVFT